MLLTLGLSRRAVHGFHGIGDNPDSDKEETVTEESKTKSSKKENTEEV